MIAVPSLKITTHGVVVTSNYFTTEPKSTLLVSMARVSVSLEIELIKAIVGLTFLSFPTIELMKFPILLNIPLSSSFEAS